MSDDSGSIPRPRTYAEIVTGFVSKVFDDDKNPPELFYVVSIVFGVVGIKYLYDSVSAGSFVGLDLSVNSFGAAFVCLVLARHVKNRQR